MTDPITTPAQMREAAARECERLGAEFAAEGAPTAKKIMDFASDLIRALPAAEPVSGRDAIRPHLIAERQRWWSPEYPGQTPPTLAVWWRDEPEDGLTGFDTRQDRDAFLRGEPGPFIRRITGNEFPQLPCADNRALPVAERQAIRDRALDDAARAASDRATYWWDEATAADDAGRTKLSLSYEAKALACTELAAAIRVMKGKPE